MRSQRYKTIIADFARLSSTISRSKNPEKRSKRSKKTPKQALYIGFRAKTVKTQVFSELIFFA